MNNALNNFNKELKHGNIFFRSFSGANSKHIVPTLAEDLQDNAIINVSTKQILNKSKQQGHDNKHDLKRT